MIAPTCRRGHPRTLENTTRDRHCRTCRREWFRERDAKRRGDPTMCVRGQHPLTPENTDSRGRCRTCRRERPQPTTWRCGHPRKPENTSVDQCRRCVNARHRKHRAENLETSRAYHREYSHRPAERGKRLAAGQIYRDANREKIRKQARAAIARDPEKKRKACRESYARHPEKAKERYSRRRARKAGVVNTLTLAEWRELKAQAKGRCMYCAIPCSTLTMDHIVPLVHGGAHTQANVAAICSTCNARKHARTIEEFWNELRADGCVL